jgi:rSAM-associated Gly-rich repeat protein
LILLKGIFFVRVLKRIIISKIKIMQFSSKVSFVGFLLALSTLGASTANATSEIPTSENQPLTIENRLSRLTGVMKERGIEISPNADTTSGQEIAGFANARGGGGFVNNRGGGGFVNSRWGDGGSFYNSY